MLALRSALFCLHCSMLAILADLLPAQGWSWSGDLEAVQHSKSPPVIKDIPITKAGTYVLAVTTQTWRTTPYKEYSAASYASFANRNLIKAWNYYGPDVRMAVFELEAQTYTFKLSTDTIYDTDPKATCVIRATARLEHVALPVPVWTSQTSYAEEWRSIQAAVPAGHDFVILLFAAAPGPPLSFFGVTGTLQLDPKSLVHSPLLPANVYKASWGPPYDRASPLKLHVQVLSIDVDRMAAALGSPRWPLR